MRVSALLEKLEVPHEGGTRPGRWINNDIKPIERNRRTWGFWSFHNLWVTINFNITTYMSGSSLIAIGLTWWQALICIIVGGSMITGCVILNSMAGARYHVGFPVANRYVWGMYGSQFVILNRILLSFVWYAVQAWIGGQCVYVCLQAIWPSLEHRIPNHMPETTGMTTAQFAAYIIFSVISLPLIWIRPHKLQPFFWIAVVTALSFMVILLIWALATMGPEGFGSTISSNGNSTVTLDSRGWSMVYGIVSQLGSIAAGILNQNDYTRFARRPRSAVQGQLAAAGAYFVLSGTIGILVTAATQNRFGKPLWNLPTLLSAIISTGGPRSRVAAFFSGFALIVSQFGINIPGNALSGGFDLAATFPRFINIRRGAYITALLSMAVNPWRLLSTASIFLTVMSSYGVFLGPMVGLMVSSFYITNRQKINVADLYIGNHNSVYWHTLGINYRAVVAWLCGVIPSMPGFIANVNPALKIPVGAMRLYYVNFLSGFAIASVVYIGLHWMWPAGKVKAFVDAPGTKVETMEFYRAKWDSVGTEAEMDPVVSVMGQDLKKTDREAVLEIP